MKVVKKILWVLAILVFLLIAALVATPFLFKDKLIELAKEEINKQVNATIEFGEFDLSVFKSFPDLNFEISNVKAIGKGEFEKDTLIALDKLIADVNLMSVFGDEIKVNTIELQHPVIHAIVRADSLANWDIAPASADTVEIAEEADTSSSAFALKLKKLIISDAYIYYTDAPMDFSTSIENMDFSLDGDLTADFTSLNINALIERFTVEMEGVKYLNKTNTELIASIDADLAGFKFTFKENSLRLNFLELGFDGWVAMPADDIDMDITFNASKTSFRNILSLVPAVYLTDFESVETDGKLALNGMAKGTYSDNTLPAFNLNLLVENARFKYPDLPGAASNINIDLNVANHDGIEDHTLINLRKFHIDFENNPFDARLVVKTPISNPDLDAEIKGTIDLDKIKNVVPLDDMTLQGIINADIKMKGTMAMLDNEDYEAFEALGMIGLQGLNYKSEDLPQGIMIKDAQMTVSPQFFQLDRFDADLGGSDIQMNGKIENFLAYVFRDELIKGSFNFSSSSFDLNQFLTDEEEAIAETESATETEEDLEVYAIPTNIDFELSTTIGKLRYDNIDITNLKGVVIMRGGSAQMNGLTMNMMQGTLGLDGLYNTVNPSKPYIEFKMDMKDFDIPMTYTTFNTIQKFAPVAEHCEGKMSVKVEMKSELLQSMEPDLNTVDAFGNLKTAGIVVKNSKAFSKISEELKIKSLDNLSFNNIDLKFTIKDGRIHIEPFKTKVKANEIEMAGSQGLDQTLDYTMTLRIPRKEFGQQANNALNTLISEAGSKGIEVELGEFVDVDVLIGGTVTDPKIKLSLKDQAKNLANDIKEQVVEKVKEEFDKAKADAIAKAKAQAAKILAEAEAKGEALIKKAEAAKKTAMDAARKGADVAKNNAYAQAKKVEDAASGQPKPLRDAAKKSADKMRKEADGVYNKALKEAEDKANKGVNEAKNQKANLLSKAKEEGDALIKKAENS